LGANIPAMIKRWVRKREGQLSVQWGNFMPGVGKAIPPPASLGIVLGNLIDRKRENRGKGALRPAHDSVQIFPPNLFIPLPKTYHQKQREKRAKENKKINKPTIRIRLSPTSTYRVNTVRLEYYSGLLLLRRRRCLPIPENWGKSRRFGSNG